MEITAEGLDAQQLTQKTQTGCRRENTKKIFIKIEKKRKTIYLRKEKKRGEKSQ